MGNHHNFCRFSISIFLAETLVKSFSGKGLVPDDIANATDFHLAVALAAGLTVILATLTGFPISTTHGLTGALVGAGLVAMGILSIGVISLMQKAGLTDVPARVQTPK